MIWEVVVRILCWRDAVLSRLVQGWVETAASCATSCMRKGRYDCVCHARDPRASDVLMKFGSTRCSDLGTPYATVDHSYGSWLQMIVSRTGRVSEQHYIYQSESHFSFPLGEARPVRLQCSEKRLDSAETCAVDRKSISPHSLTCHTSCSKP